MEIEYLGVLYASDKGIHENCHVKGGVDSWTSVAILES